MPPSLQQSSYIRYLKARLQPLKRPMFWVSAAGLSLAVLGIWQYWRAPEWYEATWNQFVTSLNQPTTEPSLSSEELAARMVDIDSSSVLLSEFDRANLLPLPVQPNEDSNTRNSQGSSALSTPGPSQSNSKLESNRSSLLALPQPNQNNVLGLPASNSLNIGSLSGSGLLTNPTSSRNSSSTTARANSEPSLGFNSLSSPNTNRGTAPVSPLQEALNRVTPAKSATVDNSAQAPASTQSQRLPASADQGQGQLTAPPTTAQGQITLPPATVPSSSGYNSSGQWVSPPTTPPIGSPYNAAGQLVTPPVTAPAAPFAGNSGIPSVAPVTPSTVGQQYPSQVPNQPYGVPSPGLNSRQTTPRLQPSQLNRSGL